MLKAFTLVEVSILFVIFLIVAILVAPLSLDDTMQAKYTSKWRSVQTDFNNIFYAINTQNDSNDIENSIFTAIKDEIKGDVKDYKITFLNGTYPNITYRFKNYKLTSSGATVAFKMNQAPKTDILGFLMYDVNGASGPNVWGKDVFGLNIYKDKFEPFCKEEPLNVQKQECSKDGTGLCCSNYYLMGGSF